MYELFFLYLTFKGQFIQPNSTIIVLSKRIFNVNEDVGDIFLKEKIEKKYINQNAAAIFSSK